MLNLRYVGSEDFYQINFKQNGDNLITITGDFPVKRQGFKIYLAGETMPIGDYSSFVTVYREIEGGAMFSNDASVFVPSVKFTANGGNIEGETIQEVYKFEDLVIPTPVETETQKFVGWKPEIPTSGEIKDHVSFTAMFEYIPTEEELLAKLEANKIAKISESNTILEDYLERHPLVSDCHGGVEATYNVTYKKQTLMANNYMTYTLEKETGAENPTLTWNATGEECEPWTEEEYVTLVLQIKNYVKPLVALQQSYEKQIKNCETQEELDAIAIIYDVYGIAE